MTDPIKLVRAPLRAAGLELIAGTTVQNYNDAVPPGYELPDLGRSNTLAVVIGNTATLWPKLGEIWDDPAYQPDPVDRYTSRVIQQVVSQVPLRSDIRFSYEGEPRRVAIQRLAHLAGLAWLSPSHLSIHREFGPWIAWRAAVVFDCDGPTSDPPDPPCDCTVGCLPAFQKALEAGVPGSKADLKDRWMDWVAFRDACSVGRAHRYSDAQIRYHYTHDPSARPPKPA